MKTLNAKKELNLLRVLFFLFGLGIMSWVPRFPEVKAALHLTNGGFGSLISSGAIGSVSRRYFAVALASLSKLGMKLL